MSYNIQLPSLHDNVLIRDLKVAVFNVPTSTPEADGTIEWSSTTMILVEIAAGDKTGIGYTYGHMAAGEVIDRTLKELVIGKDVMQLPAISASMIRAIRNIGAFGVAMMAVSAVDIALWDLKAKVLDVPL